MDAPTLRAIARTRTFKVVLVLMGVYGLGAVYFFGWIQPDATKQPGDPATWFRDLVWIIYWRWELDALIVATFIGVLVLESVAFKQAVEREWASPRVLATYVSPALNMGFAYLYMLAIDLGVTYMADAYLGGSFESEEIIWFGFTARGLYHNFFFWFIPLVVICAATNQVVIHARSYKRTFKAFCIYMAVYSLNLGLLDPVVCHVLWGDWRVFGDWAMGGADAMFAEGWIAHYVIFAVAWVVGAFLIERVAREITSAPVGPTDPERLEP